MSTCEGQIDTGKYSPPFSQTSISDTEEGLGGCLVANIKIPMKQNNVAFDSRSGDIFPSFLVSFSEALHVSWNELL